MCTENIQIYRHTFLFLDKMHLEENVHRIVNCGTKQGDCSHKNTRSGVSPEEFEKTKEKGDWDGGWMVGNLEIAA